jgi:O-antigen/teichoic acid export membrane protein
MVSGTILTVLIPRFSRLQTGREIRTMLRVCHRWLLLLVPLGIVTPLLSRFAIELVAPAFVDSSQIFSILFISILFSLAALPSRTVLYSLKRPEIETYVELLALVVVVAIGYLLVRWQGGLGAAVAMLIQRSLSAALIVGWVYRRLDRTPNG